MARGQGGGMASSGPAPLPSPPRPPSPGPPSRSPGRGAGGIGANFKVISPWVGGSLPPGRGAVGSGGRLGGGQLRQAEGSVDFAATPSWPPPSPPLPLPRGRDPRPAFRIELAPMGAGGEGQ